MNETLIRAARAAYYASADPGSGMSAFEALSSTRREQWMKSARAVIEAIREPTIAMEEAPNRKAKLAGVGTFTARTAWQAMIDQILKDE